MLKLFREVGERPSSLLCGNLFNAVGIAKLILVWPKLSEAMESCGRPVKRKVGVSSENLQKHLFIRVLNMPLDYHRISCYHEILYQKCWNSELGHLFDPEKALRAEGVPENFIDIPKVFWTIWRISLAIRTILIKFLDISTFSYCK